MPMLSVGPSIGDIGWGLDDGGAEASCLLQNAAHHTSHVSLNVICERCLVAEHMTFPSIATGCPGIRKCFVPATTTRTGSRSTRRASIHAEIADYKHGHVTNKRVGGVRIRFNGRFYVPQASTRNQSLRPDSDV